MSMLDDISNKNIWMIGAVITGITVVPAYKSGITQTMGSNVGYLQTASKHLPNVDNSKGSNDASKDTSNTNSNKQPDDPAKSNAKDETKQGYQFSYGTDGTASISGYNGSSKDINIPAYTKVGDKIYKITSIVHDAFADNQLTNVTIPNSVTYLGDRAFMNNKLTNVIIPNSVTCIGAYLFKKNQLTSVNIPTSITSIPNGVFSYNKLTTVNVPDSVIEIYNYAFDSSVKINRTD